MVTTYSYTAGQLTSIDYSDTTPDVTTTYDRLGRQTSSSSLLSSASQSSVSYAYHSTTLALDTETVTIDPDGYGSLPALTRILDRSRDNLGREGSTGILPVSNGAAEHFLTYGYDASGRLSPITSPAGAFTYAYTPGSSLIATVTTFPLPLGEGQGEGAQLTVTNTWESNRDVLDVKDNRIPSTTTPISRFDYNVNNIGQRTGVTTTGTAFPSQPADWIWGYDALGQVVSADSPNNDNDRAYEYDQIGNRKKSADGELVTTGSSAITYDPNPLNQYSSVGSFSPTYDADGNQKDAQILPFGSSSLVSCVYHWDAENRLVAVKDTNGADIVTYLYDSQSRRVARVQGSSVTLYLYDAWNCLAEYTLQNSSFNLHTSFIRGLDLSGSLQGAGGVGGLLAVSKYQPQGTTHYYPNFDGNGNVSEYLTGTGSVAAHFQYDTFGRLLLRTGFEVAGLEYLHSTKPIDMDLGLYYFGYRHYDPQQGRWLSMDPISQMGGNNLYGMLGNQTPNRFDLLGLWFADGRQYSKKYAKLNATIILDGSGGFTPTIDLSAFRDPSVRAAADAHERRHIAAAKASDTKKAIPFKQVYCLEQKDGTVKRKYITMEGGEWIKQEQPLLVYWKGGKHEPKDYDNKPYWGRGTQVLYKTPQQKKGEELKELRIEKQQLEELGGASVERTNRIKDLTNEITKWENMVVGEEDDPAWRDFKQAYKSEKERAKNDGQIFSWATPNKQHIYEELINIP